MNDKTLTELLKDSPLAAVAGMTFLGVSLNDWVLIMAALYGAVRLVHALIDLWAKIKEKWNVSKR